MLKVTVLYNLPESDLEADLDTQKSALDVANNLDATLLGIRKNELMKIKKIKSDVIFNLIEWAGTNTEYGVGAVEMLEKTGIPYTGSNAYGYRLSCDKFLMKQTMKKFGIPTPGKKNFPLIVKPAYEHCGIGVNQRSVVENKAQLEELKRSLTKEFGNQPIVEEYIDGRELHVTILENSGKPWVLPPAEVVFQQKPGWRPILSYAGKWDESSDEYPLSRMELADLDSKVKSRITKIAEICYKKLGGRDYPRLDIRLRGEEIFVLEINNNPGIDYDVLSGIGVSARAVGLTWSGLLNHIVENAYLRGGKYDAVTF